MLCKFDRFSLSPKLYLILYLIIVPLTSELKLSLNHVVLIQCQCLRPSNINLTIRTKILNSILSRYPGVKY
jgi:hypothetical protein